MKWSDWTAIDSPQAFDFGLLWSERNDISIKATGRGSVYIIENDRIAIDYYHLLQVDADSRVGDFTIFRVLTETYDMTATPSPFTILKAIANEWEKEWNQKYQAGTLNQSHLPELKEELSTDWDFQSGLYIE